MKKEFKVKARGLYKPGSDKPFKVSRSGIELFMECSCCFYLNNRLGIRRPSGPPFNINKAVDALLKKEFDVHRDGQTPHPYMQQYGIEAVPLQHEMMDEWRENFKGVQYVHAPTNLLVTGAVDDLWQNPDGEIIVVDYKATSKNGEVSLDAEWQMGYKRQMEVYQWLMRNTSVSASTLKYLKSEDGIGPGIERLVQSITYNFMSPGTSTSPEPVFAGVERLVFYNDYPIFDDENNLSMVLFLKCYGTGVMFTGDLEKDGFAALLRNDALFKQALRETNVYIAPHHGRENGCSEYILPYLTNVYYVVISDKGYMYDTQQTMPFYSRIAKGGPFRGTTRKILTTRNDGRIGFTFSVNSWGPY